MVTEAHQARLQGGDPFMGRGHLHHIAKFFSEAITGKPLAVERVEQDEGARVAAYDADQPTCLGQAGLADQALRKLAISPAALSRCCSWVKPEALSGLRS